MGIGDSMIRLSVGLEDAQDLLADFAAGAGGAEQPTLTFTAMNAPSACPSNIGKYPRCKPSWAGAPAGGVPGGGRVQTPPGGYQTVTPTRCASPSRLNATSCCAMK